MKLRQEPLIVLTFKVYINEVVSISTNSRSHGNKILPDGGGPTQSNAPFHSKEHGFKHIGTTQSGHKVWHSEEGGVHDFHFEHPEETGKIDVSVRSVPWKRNPKAHDIKSLSARSGSHLRPEHAYAHMIKRMGMTLTTKAQTPGSQSVWRKLAKIRGVTTHGLNADGKPVNVKPGEDDHEDIYRSDYGDDVRGATKRGEVPKYLVATPTKGLKEAVLHDNPEEEDKSTWSHLGSAAFRFGPDDGPPHNPDLDYYHSREGFKHISTTSTGHKVYRYVRPDNPNVVIYHFHDPNVDPYHPKHRIHLEVRTHHNGKAKVGHIDSVTAKDHSTIPAHEAYAHLLHHGHLNAIVGSFHSLGGKAVWERLAKQPRISVHGWDPETKKPVNVKPGSEDEEDIYYRDTDRGDHDDEDDPRKNRQNRMEADRRRRMLLVASSTKKGKGSKR